MTSREINQLLRQTLHQMEDAAVPATDRYPVGLHWFVHYIQERDQLLSEPRNHEVQWTREMTRLLISQGFAAEAEKYYPGTKERCDVVLKIPGLGEHWIEVKGCWPAYLDECRPNSSFKKHLAAASHDFDKLLSLDGKIASGTSMVLIGFDDRSFEISNEHLTQIVDKINKFEWTHDYSEWWSTGTLIYRTRIWIWTRIAV